MVLPLLQLRQHHIFYEPLAHIERCLAKRIDDGRHINLHEYPKIVLRVIQHKRNFLAFGCFFSGSKHGNHFCAITKPCRYPSWLASALRMEFLIRRQIFGIESPKQFIKIGPDRDEKWSLRQRSNDKLQCWLISIVFLRKCTDSGFEKTSALPAGSPSGNVFKYSKSSSSKSKYLCFFQRSGFQCASIYFLAQSGS